MAKIPSHTRRWSAKKHILAALLGALVAIAIVAGISISLAPAHISFSIASGGIITPSSIPKQNNNNQVQYKNNTQVQDKCYNFTVVANNNSSRTAVRYGSLSVQIWYSPTGWVPAEANMTAEQQLADWHLPGNATNFPVLAQFFEYNQVSTNGQLDTEKSNITWPNCSVVVEAKVWFKFGRARTRQYTVRASCYPVDFQDGVTAPVSCTS